MLKEDCLEVFEVWSSRICRGLEESRPLSDMKATDDFAVSEVEFPFEEEEAKEGMVHYVPAAGEGSSGTAAADGVAFVNGKESYSEGRVV